MRISVVVYFVFVLYCICMVYLYGVFLCISVFSKDYEGGGAAVKRGR